MTKTNMKATTDHALEMLVGKKIKKIYLQEIDIQGDGSDVRQFYTFHCSDGEKFVLAMDGGNTQQYVVAELMEVDEFQDFLETIEQENNSVALEDGDDAEIPDLDGDFDESDFEEGVFSESEEELD